MFFMELTVRVHRRPIGVARVFFYHFAFRELIAVFAPLTFTTIKVFYLHISILIFLLRLNIFLILTICIIITAVFAKMSK